MSLLKLKFNLIWLSFYITCLLILNLHYFKTIFLRSILLEKSLLELSYSSILVYYNIEVFLTLGCVVFLNLICWFILIFIELSPGFYLFEVLIIWKTFSFYGLLMYMYASNVAPILEKFLLYRSLSSSTTWILLTPELTELLFLKYFCHIIGLTLWISISYIKRFKNFILFTTILYNKIFTIVYVSIVIRSYLVDFNAVESSENLYKRQFKIIKYKNHK